MSPHAPPPLSLSRQAAPAASSRRCPRPAPRGRRCAEGPRWGCPRLPVRPRPPVSPEPPPSLPAPRSRGPGSPAPLSGEHRAAAGWHRGGQAAQRAPVRAQRGRPPAAPPAVRGPGPVPVPGPGRDAAAVRGGGAQPAPAHLRAAGPRPRRAGAAVARAPARRCRCRDLPHGVHGAGPRRGSVQGAAERGAALHALRGGGKGHGAAAGARGGSVPQQGECDQFKDFPFSRETGSPRQRHRRPPSLTSGPSKELRRGETQNQNDHHFQEGLSPHQELPFLPGAPADLVLQAGQDRQQGAVPEEAAQAGPEPQPHQAAAGHAGGPGVPAGARPAQQPPGGLQRGPVQLGPAEIPAAAGPEPEPDPGAAAGVLPAAGAGAAAAGRQRPAAPALPHRAAQPPALPVGRAQQAALPALGLQEPLPGEPGPLWESLRAAQPAGSQHPAEDPPDSAGVCCQGHGQSQDPLWLPPAPFPPVQGSGGGQDVSVRQRLPEQLHPDHGDHEPAPRGAHRGARGQHGRHRRARALLLLLPALLLPVPGQAPPEPRLIPARTGCLAMEEPGGGTCGVTRAP